MAAVFPVGAVGSRAARSGGRLGDAGGALEATSATGIIGGLGVVWAGFAGWIGVYAFGWEPPLLLGFVALTSVGGCEWGGSQTYLWSSGRTVCGLATG
jgi:hypothetical protein